MLESIRKNPMIVAGIALPLLVALFFVIATAVPRAMTDPPGHDFLFTTYGYRAGPPGIELRLDVVDQRFRARAFATDVEYRNVPRLYRYEHEDHSLREILIDMPEGDFESGTELAVPELSGLRISTAARSPDGYTLAEPDYRGDGLLGLFFGGGRSRGMYLEKDGAVYEVPDAPGQNVYFANASFLGWVIDD